MVLSTISGTPCPLSNIGQRFNIANIPCGISYAFTKQSRSPVINKLSQRARPVEIRKPDCYSQCGQNMSKQRVRRSVKLMGGDDIAPNAGKIMYGVADGRLSAAYAQSCQLPPSRAATRRSSTSVVGLPIRV